MTDLRVPESMLERTGLFERATPSDNSASFGNGKNPVQSAVKLHELERTQEDRGDPQRVLVLVTPLRHASETRADDHRKLGVPTPHRRDELEPIEALAVELGDHDLRTDLFPVAQRLAAIGDPHHPPSTRLKKPLQKECEANIGVHDENSSS
jgi:hypothetical protein